MCHRLWVNLTFIPAQPICKTHSTMQPELSSTSSNHPASPPSTDAPPRPVSPRRRFLGFLCWLYLATVLGLWLLLHFAGDRWWIATLLLFGPLWVFALPLILLLPLALFLRRRSLPVLMLGGLIVLFPILDFCIPWRPSLYKKSQSSTSLRVL